MYTDFICKLDEKHQSLSSNDNEYNKMKEEIDFLRQFIKDFFSNNGEAKAIHDMYISIEKNPNTRIICTDVYKNAKIYEEYIKGMTEFINDVNDFSSNECVLIDSFKEKLDKAMENDGKFIASLQDGSISNKEETTIQSAIINVEYLIDLINYMETVKGNADKLVKSISDESYSKEKKDLLARCLDLLCKSIRSYCFNTVKGIIDTYGKIYKIINNEVELPAQTDSKFVLY